MKPHFLGFVRIFYTTALILLALADLVFWMVERAATSHGHGNFTNFLWSEAIFWFLYLLLLASRILGQYRSPQWYWLGAPTALLLGVPAVVLLIMTVGGVVFGIGV